MYWTIILVDCLLLMTCFVIVALVDKLQFRNGIKVPFLPNDHLLCWWNSLEQLDQLYLLELCETNNLKLINFDNLIVKDPRSVRNNICNVILELNHQNQTLPCWGYEESENYQNCSLYKSTCPGSSDSWSKNKAEQLKLFFNTADFGYVRKRKAELDYYCRPNSGIKSRIKSELKCTKYLRYCTGENIYIDFNRLANLSEPIRYRDDILGQADIGGWNCDLHRQKLLNEDQQKSTLMSWFSEISNFNVIYDKSPLSDYCHIVIDKPTFIMKLDATINMYHHFCDFINLYISFHMNGTFNLDNNILIWDTYPYRSNFAPIWSAFTSNTNNNLLSLSQFKGKKVCFRNVIFPLLPRMIYGLYYNMPLVPGCEGSGLVRAFNRHLLHHLGLKGSEQLVLDDHKDHEETIRIVFISRTTKHRRVLNEEELIRSLNKTLNLMKQQANGSSVQIRMVDFNHRMSFQEQIRITSRADILIGMHGAGLTHCLFQPDYGALFELYNCGDVDCYRDLARLRGVHYETWTKMDKLKPVDTDLDSQQQQQGDRKSFGAAHAKFVNYNFDSEEFVGKIMDIIKLVRERRKQFRRQTERLWWWEPKSDNINQIRIQQQQSQYPKKNIEL